MICPPWNGCRFETFLNREFLLSLTHKHLRSAKKSVFFFESWDKFFAFHKYCVAVVLQLISLAVGALAFMPNSMSLQLSHIKRRL
jgi:hypothetical protein